MQNTVSKIQEFAIPKQSNIRPIVLAGISILALFVSLYVYFVGKIVFDVVAEREANMSIRASQSELSSLEVDYYNKIKTVTLAQAPALGLTESNDTLFASRADASAETVGMVLNH
jgi:hypothetical protein